MKIYENIKWHVRVKNNSAIKSERDKFLFLMFQGNNGYTEILTIS